MRQREDLIRAIQDHVNKLSGTQAEKANALGISQPRLNNLLRNRTEKFSVDALTSIAVRAGLRVNVHVQELTIGGTDLSGVSVIRHREYSNSPYSVDASELKQLDAKNGTLLIQRILRCEALSVGVGPQNVVLSMEINKPDGGIDAKVEGVPKNGSLLKEGSTHIQIKTGPSFKPWQPSQLKKELFGSSTAKPSRKLLGAAIKDCLDSDGEYVVITLGHDLLPHDHTKAERELLKLLKSCGYPTPRANVFGCGQIAGVITKFPSLCIELKGLPEEGFQSLSGWRSNSLMGVTYHISEDQAELIATIRTKLADDSIQHIRLTGEPGIGKTRLVLEAVSEESIAPSVIYVPSGQEFQNSRLINELVKPDREFTATLVVDDCDMRDRVSIWSTIKGRVGIRLITIDHETDRSQDSSMLALECPPLPSDQIVDILKDYVEPSLSLGNWADWCGGSPRVAHAVGSNLQLNPDDILKAPAEVEIWDRFILGHKKLDSIESEQHRVVLRHVALFQRFGFEPPVESEARFISSLIEKVDPAITWGKFQSIIQHHRNRRILQGHHTLFIVPKALHVYLWIEYWRNYGRDFDFSSIAKNLPQGMQDWFFSLFIYASNSETALFVVKHLLSESGPLTDQSFLESTHGPRLINYLAEADPSGTLNLIERTYGHWSHSKLHAWHSGRQDIVWALEKLAVWDNTFLRAVQVLIRLALAENARNSNNSKGVLLGLFRTGIGWAPTQAPASKRIQVIKDLVTNKQDPNCRKLGFEMCEEWFKTHGGYRQVGPEHQGLRPEIEFWRPQTYGELWDTWRQLWRFLRDELQGVDPADGEILVSVLCGAAKSIVKVGSLSDEILDTLHDIADIEALDTKPLVDFVINQIRYRKDELTPAIVARIQSLDDKVTGTTLWQRIKRYVLDTSWDEDYRVHNDDVEEISESRERVIELAREFMADTDEIDSLLPNLISCSGHRLQQFGFECGKIASSSAIDETLFELIEQKSDLTGEYLGGFLSGVRVIDNHRWESRILRMLDDGNKYSLAVDCLRRTGYSTTVLQKMKSLYLEGHLPSTAFSSLAYRQDNDHLLETDLIGLLELLSHSRDEYSAGICVDLVFGFYIHRKQAHELPEHLIYKILTNLFSDENEINPADWYHWSKITERFLVQFPNRKLEMLTKIVTFGELSRHGSEKYVGEIAESILNEQPDESWRIISKCLEDPAQRWFSLVYWLGDKMEFDDDGKSNLINCLPHAEMVSWVKENQEDRLSILMELLPKTLRKEDGGSLTRIAIEEFSSGIGFSQSLIGHFLSGGWRGPESSRLESKRDEARQWLATPNSTTCTIWIERFISYLDEHILTAKIREERGF